MKNNKVFRLMLLLLTILFGLTACKKEPVEEPEEQVEQEKVELQQAFKPDAAVLETITVEVGSELPSAESFYSEYSGQVFELQGLSQEQMAQVGTHSVTIISDGHKYKVDVNVVDTTPPVIEGVEDKAVQKGGTVSYKNNVIVKDNSNEEIKVEIDNSQANLNEEGVYPVYYTAADSSGNITKVEIMVTVTEKPVIDEAYVRPMVEAVVNEVVNDSMSDWDKAYALFKWCRYNIQYGSSGDRTSIWTGAYEGVHNRTGDCFAYYATYAAMLEVIGIENIKVARINGESNHWWNLVNLGDGWYHCDCSPRRKGDTYVCFMQTDAQVETYTESYREKPNYYTFDKSLYPERETRIVYGE